MKVVVAKPPIYDYLTGIFPIQGRKGIYFCWSDAIYNPDNVEIPPAIMVHEGVHSVRQGSKPEDWWIRYCHDKEFRLAEELLAHRAEYQFYLKLNGINAPMPGWRSKLDFHLTKVAQRLSSPLYGSMVSTSKARRLICGQS